jgi:hypothetical protein
MVGLRKRNHLRNSKTEILPERSASTLRKDDQSLLGENCAVSKGTAQCHRGAGATHVNAYFGSAPGGGTGSRIKANPPGPPSAE